MSDRRDTYDNAEIFAYVLLASIAIGKSDLGTVQKLCHPGRGREGVSQKMILAYGGRGGVRLKLMDDDDGGTYEICHFSIINRAEVLLSSLLNFNN